MFAISSRIVVFLGASLFFLSAGWTLAVPAAFAQNVSLTRVQSSAELVGTWVRERSSAVTYQKITLILRDNGTYTKTLESQVNGANYGGTHNGRWSAQGSVVSLSGDGNWPALTHDLAEFQKVQ